MLKYFFIYSIYDSYDGYQILQYNLWLVWVQYITMCIGFQGQKFVNHNMCKYSPFYFLTISLLALNLQYFYQSNKVRPSFHQHPRGESHSADHHKYIHSFQI